jgi:hypothetical protein
MSKNLIHLMLMTVMASGCDNGDARIAAVANAAAERQAQQSTEMAKAHGHLTQGARELVESAARSQESLVTIQRELETQQTEVGHQRDLLEQERRTIATQRRTDPVIANAVLQLGLLLICSLPLVICWYVLRSPGTVDADRLVNEILIEELTTAQPRLLPGPVTKLDEPTGHLPSPD